MASIKRIGCLGQLTLLALGAIVVWLGIAALTNPWIYTVGGHRRWLPFWTGVGTIQGPGGTYVLFIGFYPSHQSSKVLPSTSVSGTGWICGPSGHDYRIRISGGAHEVVWRSMDGEPFAFRIRGRRGFTGSTSLPPKLDFAGRWAGPTLVMNDGGTVANAFLQDGSLNPHPGSNHESKPITFTERWWLIDPCSSATN